MRFRGRTAAVTGGAHGIGRELALALAAEGARTFVLDVDEARLGELGGHENVTPLRADFETQAGAELADALFEAGGAPDLVVNNVGVGSDARPLDVEPEEWERTLRVNVTTPFFFTQAIAKRLRDEGRRGAVVFVSSLHAERPHRAAHYSASKAAVEMAAKELAADLAGDGIRVNLVRPGWIATTPDGIPPDPLERAPQIVPAGRIGQPRDLVGVVLSLLDDSVSEYVTGSVVAVDGGLGLYTWS